MKFEVATLKAAVLEEIGAPLVVAEIDIAAPVGREVLVDVRASGLCHTDLHIMQSGRGVDLPLVLGHELAGTVVGVGPAVTEFAVGDRVVGCLVSHCGHCRQCLSGHTYRCAHRQETQRVPGDPPRLSRDGKPVAQGFDLAGFAEQALVHENNLVVIGDGIAFDTACLLGCGVVTGAGSVFNSARVSVGETVAVLGCGGVGLSAVQAARLAGALRVVAVDIHPAKLKLASQLGATDIVDATEGDPVDAVVRLTGGVDHAFETAGQPATARQAFDMLALGGTAYQIGMQPTGSVLEYPGNSFLVTQRAVRGIGMGSTTFKVDIPMLADYVQQQRFDLDAMVGQRISLDEINDGYRGMLEGSVARTVVTR
jgi:S-(hydroxymethyl)glutathione dehydrogenase / alcohol dehydrogenase